MYFIKLHRFAKNESSNKYVFAGEIGVNVQNIAYFTRMYLDMNNVFFGILQSPEKIKAINPNDYFSEIHIQTGDNTQSFVVAETVETIYRLIQESKLK